MKQGGNIPMFDNEDESYLIYPKVKVRNVKGKRLRKFKPSRAR